MSSLCIPLLGHIEIARAAEPSDIIHTIEMNDREASSVSKTKVRIVLDFISLDGKVGHKTFKQTDTVAAHYTAIVFQDTQISCPTTAEKVPALEF